jgi:TonB family protein
MAHHSMFDPDPANPAPSAPGDRPEREGLSPLEDVPGKLDLVELAEKFTVHGGGQVSPQVSVDLALDLVLNEIAEQACLATPASGAAIVLERDGEWVCRASAGGNAPSLGARLDAEAGLSGACIKTRQVQRCDDAQSDPRADVEACRTLGVRSVIILPLLQSDELVGVFEIFSSNPAAFGRRDESTLEVLSQRVLTILRQTSEPLHTSVEPANTSDQSPDNSILENSRVEDSVVKNSIAEKSDGENTTAKDAAKYQSDDAPLSEATSEVAAGRGINLLTWILGAAVLAFALLLTVLMGVRLFRGRTASRSHQPATVSARLSDAGHNSATGASATKETGTSLVAANQTKSARPSGTSTSGSTSRTPATGTPHGTSPPSQAGSLLVFEKGKEIFRMPPAAEQGERSDVAGTNRTVSSRVDGSVDRPPSGGERANIYELSPEAASGSLLHRVEPEYPQEALQQQIQGPVALDVRIGRDGTVQKTELISGERLLANAAIAAVKQWRFKPRVVKGQPVEMQTTITLNFRLPR